MATTLGQHYKRNSDQSIFPKMKDRLNIKITLAPNFTAMVTAHGKSRSYLHRFKIIESPECPCGNGTQTVEHLLYDCGKLNNERGKLTANSTKEDHWPVRKSVLVSKYLKQVIHFSNSMTMKSCNRTLCANTVS